MEKFNSEVSLKYYIRLHTYIYLLQVHKSIRTNFNLWKEVNYYFEIHSLIAMSRF